jgi:hypothetical protein
MRNADRRAGIARAGYDQCCRPRWGDQAGHEQGAIAALGGDAQELVDAARINLIRRGKMRRGQRQVRRKDGEVPALKRGGVWGACTPGMGTWLLPQFP